MINTVFLDREMLEQSSVELVNTISDLEEKNDNVEGEGKRICVCLIIRCRISKVVMFRSFILLSKIKSIKEVSLYI